MNPFNSLSEDNHDQIRKYLRFFRQKKEASIRSLQREINDIKNDRLDGDMYTREEIQDFTDFLASAIQVCNHYNYIFLVLFTSQVFTRVKSAVIYHP